jgi:hypothetical protein
MRGNNVGDKVHILSAEVDPAGHHFLLHLLETHNN